MALTATQKSAIRLYLGFPDGFRFANTRLESVMDNVSPEGEIQISGILTNLATIETQIATGPGSPILNNGVKRVDEITFFGTDQDGPAGFKSLKDAGKYYVGQLSIILGVPRNASAFTGQGYPGDSFFPGFGRSDSSIRLG